MQLPNKIILLVIIAFLIESTSGFEIGVKPPALSFEGKVNESICKELNVIYSGERITIEIEERWTNNLKEEDYNFYNRYTKEIKSDYPRYIEIESDKKIDVCVNAKKSGVKKGILILDVLEKRAGIMVKIDLDVKENNSRNLTDLNQKKRGAYLLGFNSLLCFLVLLMLLKLQKNRRQITRE